MLNPKLPLQLLLFTAILLAGCTQKPAPQSCCELDLPTTTAPAPLARVPSMPREDLMDPIILKNALTDIDSFERTLNWQPFRPGVQIARIYVTPNGGISAAFLKYEPNASVPLHMHGGYEHIFILKGSQLDRAGENTAGTVIINPPGSSHKVASPQGCIVLIIWEKPVIIAPEK